MGTTAATLLRVTVTGGSRRVDLVLPGVVPLIELLPDVARSVGLLDGATAPGGYRLVTRLGSTLATDSSLSAQGVVDGAFLAVVAGAHDDPPRRYDDVVEAMADVVGRHLRPWHATTRHRVALGAATLLLLAAAGSLLSRPHSHLAAGAATGLAAALALAAVTHSRLRREAVAPIAMALTGCAYAAVGGLMLGTAAEGPGTSLSTAGGGLLVVAVLAAVGLTEGRALLLPPVVVGVVLLSTGVLVRASQADPATLLTAALAGVVVTGSVFPTLALAATGTQVPAPGDPADGTHDPGPVDAELLSGDARVAHEVMVAMSATVGVLLVLIAPEAVSLGIAGTLVPLLGCLVVTLRTRQSHSGVDVLVGLVSGVLGLMSTATSIVWLHPDWRLPAALGLAASGLGLLATTLLPGPSSITLGRLGDGVESLALLAISPVLVLATGLLSSVQGRVGRW